jgi:transcription antitermination factor NusG
MNSLPHSSSEALLTSSELAPDQASWFAIQTRPRYEKQVIAELQEKGIKTFLPLCSATHQWSDRRRIVELPLFPSYVFVRIAAVQETRIAVLRTHGVNNFVGARGIGTPIPDGELAAVQEILKHRIPFQTYPFLKIGQRICIRGGCLNGIRGILTAINGDYSLIVSLEPIQRSIAIRLSGYQIEPDRAPGNSLEVGKRSQAERTAPGINRQPDLALGDNGAL